MESGSIVDMSFSDSEPFTGENFLPITIIFYCTWELFTWNRLHILGANFWEEKAYVNQYKKSNILIKWLNDKNNNFRLDKIDELYQLQLW